jgi:hypothetical protein
VLRRLRGFSAFRFRAQRLRGQQSDAIHRTSRCYCYFLDNESVRSATTQRANLACLCEFCVTVSARNWMRGEVHTWRFMAANAA